MKKITKRDLVFFLIGLLTMFIVMWALDSYNESKTVKGKLKNNFKSVKKELKR